MAELELKMDVAGLNALLSFAFPDSPPGSMPQVAELAPGRVKIVRPYVEGLLRPGNLISGPNMMSLADMAAYALVLAHIGPQLMAVTSQLSINFLRGAKPGDIHVEGELLRLGRRLAICDVRIWTESPDRLAAQASVTYAIPS